MPKGKRKGGENLSSAKYDGESDEALMVPLDSRTTAKRRVTYVQLLDVLNGEGDKSMVDVKMTFADCLDHMCDILNDSYADYLFTYHYHVGSDGNNHSAGVYSSWSTRLRWFRRELEREVFLIELIGEQDKALKCRRQRERESQ